MSSTVFSSIAYYKQLVIFLNILFPISPIGKMRIFLKKKYKVLFPYNSFFCTLLLNTFFSRSLKENARNITWHSFHLLFWTIHPLPNTEVNMASPGHKEDNDIKTWIYYLNKRQGQDWLTCRKKKNKTWELGYKQGILRWFYGGINERSGLFSMIIAFLQQIPWTTAVWPCSHGWYLFEILISKMKQNLLLLIRYEKETSVNRIYPRRSFNSR